MIVGFTCSVFDLLHAGHVAMLREASDQCDWLICGLQVSGVKKPVQTLVERYTQLQAVKYVDEIIPYETEEDLEDILKMYSIDIRILGEEYKYKKFTGKDMRGIKLYFNKREHRFSSTSLKRRVFDSTPK
jgi:glycerol-3-phosphate cytidylyltransferase|tara:strand:+ start:69 stop:458 length:390 start_codon:yes stop_codon:yes gene_type:complete